MKKTEIKAIELLQDKNKELEKDIAILIEKLKDDNKKITNLRKTLKDREEDLADCNETINRIAEQHKQFDFAISEEGTPTIYTGLAYIVQLLKKIEEKL